MKLAIIPPSTKTGEYVYSKNLIKGLQNTGIDLEIVENQFFRMSNSKILLGSFFINKLVTSGSIIHNLDNLSPFLLKNNGNNKRIMTVMDIAPVIYPEIHSRLMNVDFKRLLPRMIKNSDIIIVPSVSTKNDLMKHFGTEKEKIRIIPLGIDQSFFHHELISKKSFVKYGIPSKYLLYVGTDNPRKNLKNLILGFENIINQNDHYLLLIGPINRKKLDNFIINNKNIMVNKKDLINRIITPGYVKSSDLPSIYSKASALVFPSLYEGFGFPPLESMACKTPVIISDNSSLREIVKNAGIYIKDPQNPSEIANKMQDLISNSEMQKKLGNEGFKQSKNFKWNETIKKTIKVYEEAYYGD
ncbi:MAG: glycosyltransferase family 1 protein [Methanobacteriaceae archaeon]|nr:glycosyltransferase family 1 protein [Methanobacteriaceae archaeon]